MASFVGKMTEKTRRGLVKLEKKVGLETEKELTNAINESRDVVNAYDQIIKQTNEQVHYLEKWRKVEDDCPALCAAIDKEIELNPRAMDAIKEYMAAYNAYIKVLEEIKDSDEKLHKLDATAKDLRAKVDKGKSSEGAAKGAEQERDALAASLSEQNDAAYHAAALAWGKARVKMHEQSAKAWQEYVAALEANKPAGGSGDAGKLPETPAE